MSGGIKRQTSLAPTQRSNGDPKVKPPRVARSSRNGSPHHKQLRNRKR